jgi:hypothetical protein
VGLTLGAAVLRGLMTTRTTLFPTLEGFFEAFRDICVGIKDGVCVGNLLGATDGELVGFKVGLLEGVVVG